jgi:hypothetical protein
VLGIFHSFRGRRPAGAGTADLRLRKMAVRDRDSIVTLEVSLVLITFVLRDTPAGGLEHFLKRRKAGLDGN